jgi:hypothetical protein
MLYLMLLSSQHVSTWLSYLTSGIQQVILLLLCIIFEVKNKISSWKRK